MVLDPLKAFFSWLSSQEATPDYPTKDPGTGRPVPSNQGPTGGYSRSAQPSITSPIPTNNFESILPIPVEVQELMGIPPKTNAPSTLYEQPDSVFQLEEDIAFLDALKRVENAPRVGRDIDGFWYPHPSPEGGRDTLGYGHKLTPQELKTGRITLSNGKELNFKDGLTDGEITELFYDDVALNRNKAKNQWDNFVDNKDFQFENLPRSYQNLLTNLVFNAGSLSKGDRFQWPKLAKAIQENDIEAIRREMVTSYTDPKGKTHKLTKRADILANALGLVTDGKSTS